ncbi:MAG: polyphosphate:AMP phosphotransferase [Gammaproteobacteria bacterium]
MFETAEIGHKVDKATYKKAVVELREALLNAQFQLVEKPDFPVVIVIGGVDGAGKGEMVNLLNEWMDPRHIDSIAFGTASDEERERPPFWRFWRTLPPNGRLGILIGSWYTQPVVSRVLGEATTAELDEAIHRIVHFEQMLTDEGILLLKYWFHLSREQQHKRLKKLEKDPATRWRVTDTDWQRFKIYDQFREVSEHTLRRTSTGNAPWLVVEGNDSNYRSLTVGKSLLTALNTRLAAPTTDPEDHPAPPMIEPVDDLNLLQTLAMNQAITKPEYRQALEREQGRLNQLSRHPDFANSSVVMVFEGNDAAGKGGSIRRLAQALDARSYNIIPVAAPTQDELAQPYLWRFWRKLPRRGQFTIFDRSWYGRVLVEKIEGYCEERDWMRAYSEICDFEEQLTEHGILVIKFWLAITKDEQLRRFKEREQIAFKRYKITEEDWRNRERWDEYEQAVCEMVERTSSEFAPWTLIPANNKYHARLEVLRTVSSRLEKLLGVKPDKSDKQ